MSTTRQIQASRSNGAKSKGPLTPQGKYNSSRNSIRHGLLAETIVLAAEDKPPFLESINELMEEHQPRTPTETMLVETIAVARWRQDRIWSMQKVAFDYDVSSSTSLADKNPLRAVLALRTSPESVRTHELLLRYEVALDRQISRALLRLQQLQTRELRASPLSDVVETQEKTPPAERTRQPVETVAQPSPRAQIPRDPTPQNRPPASSASAKAVSAPPARRPPSLPRKKPAA